MKPFVLEKLAKEERVAFDQMVDVQEQLVEETRDTEEANIAKKKGDEGEPRDCSSDRLPDSGGGKRTSVGEL